MSHITCSWDNLRLFQDSNKVDGCCYSIWHYNKNCHIVIVKQSGVGQSVIHTLTMCFLSRFSQVNIMCVCKNKMCHFKVVVSI
jgi:hypothetical protein